MKSHQLVLIIGYVWPETNASAAGLRDWALMEQFRGAGWKVHYASPAKPGAFSEKLEKLGVPTFSCEANDPRFDAFIRELKPDLVLFDRFVTEEQFGWRVEENCPDAIRVLDTQDLHFLRRAREAALKEGWALDRIQEASEEMIERFAQDDLYREISAIYRSDLTLVISGFEIQLLTQRYRVPANLLLLQRFSYESPKPASLPAFHERNHFVSIGNFRHPPNADAVHWLKREIWPEIRSRMPDAQVHLYGAYPSREMMDLSDPRSGFIVKGPAVDQYETLKNYRVLLAPLRYGAGIKGKISDAWSVGTPVVSTPVGAEGMSEGFQWAGEIAQTAEDFADRACDLFQREDLWTEQQQAGFVLIQRLYNPTTNCRLLLTSLTDLSSSLSERRKSNLIGGLLRHHLHKSTKYFSRWIEMKQAIKSGTPVA